MTSASQTSAPVHEYRCLFTHDLHKKQKKWHDGTLKFHTYNSRVMVYDDRQNFVGDLHYRGNEVFGEGLDLQLDKPVLVNVEDRLGESNTDLTEVLRQKADPRTIQSTHNSLPQRLSSTARPKQRSIKDLLVASQGHLGRRGLPSRSPFEQRQQQIQSTSLEPPAKRQRIHDDKEQLSPPQIRQKPVAPVSTVHASKHQDETTSKPSIGLPQLSSHTQGVRALTHSRQTTPESPVQPPRRQPVADLALPPRAKVSLHAATESQHGDPAPHRQPLPVPSITHNKRQPAVSKQRAGGARSLLTFATRKPPPRLRYKALLPGLNRSPEASCSKRQVERRDDSSERENARPKNCAHLLELDELMESQADRQAGIVLPAEDPDLVQQSQELVEGACPSDKNAPQHTASMTTADVTEVLEPEHINIDSSPLFVPYTQTQLSIPPTPPSAKTDFEIPGAEQERSQGFGNLLATQDSVQDRAAKVNTVGTGGKNGPFATDDDDDDDNDNDHDENNDEKDDFVNQIQPQTNEEVQNCVEIRHDYASTEYLEQSDTRSQTREVSEPPEPLSDAESKRSRGANSKSGDVEMDGQSSHENALPPAPASPPERTHATPTRVAPFRRVLSESNVDDADISKRAKEDSPRKTAMLPPSTSRRSGVLTASTAAVAPAALARAASDSAVLEVLEVSSTAIDAFLAEATQFQTRKQSDEENLDVGRHDQDTNVETAEPEQLEEQGPWTSAEAFLLFDKWPANRVKPDYGQSLLEDKTSKTKTKTMTGTKVRTANAATARSAESSLGHSKMGKYSNFSSARLVSQR